MAIVAYGWESKGFYARWFGWIEENPPWKKNTPSLMILGQEDQPNQFEQTNPRKKHE